MKNNYDIHAKYNSSENTPYMYLTLLFLLLALLGLPQNADAAPDWQAEITVSSGVAYNKLTLGADSTASNGYDAVWDSYAVMQGDIEAYFPHTEWGLIHEDFHRDIRAHAVGSAISWPITLNSTLIDAGFTISWDLTNVPAAYPVTLTDDSTGQQTDMRSASSYNFIYSVIRSFSIDITETSTCANLPARIAGAVPAYYSSIQAAYNAAGSSDTIQAHEAAFTEDLTINLNKSVAIEGGYDCDYTTVTGTSSLNGTMTISNGSVSIENLVMNVP